MKKILIFSLLVVFSLLICSCDKSDDTDNWQEWHDPNDNQLIAGGWVLEEMEIVELETNNKAAVNLICEQYKPKIGTALSFFETGYYCDSGTFCEIVSKYRLVDNQLYFSKDYVVKITFDENSFSFESDYTSGFQWFLNQPFMSEYKDTSIAKVVMKEVYKKIIHDE